MDSKFAEGAIINRTVVGERGINGPDMHELDETGAGQTLLKTKIAGRRDQEFFHAKNTANCSRNF